MYHNDTSMNENGCKYFLYPYVIHDARLLDVSGCVGHVHVVV